MQYVKIIKLLQLHPFTVLITTVFIDDYNVRTTQQLYCFNSHLLYLCCTKKLYSTYLKQTKTKKAPFIGALRPSSERGS